MGKEGWRYVWVKGGKAFVSTKPRLGEDTHYVPEHIWARKANIKIYCAKVGRIQTLVQEMVKPKK